MMTLLPPADAGDRLAFRAARQQLLLGGKASPAGTHNQRKV
jgi:hypothetical protein